MLRLPIALLVIALLCVPLPSLLPGVSRTVGVAEALRRNVDVAVDGDEDYDDEYDEDDSAEATNLPISGYQDCKWSPPPLGIPNI